MFQGIRTLHYQSRGTQLNVPMQFQLQSSNDKYNHWNQLFKEDSGSSDQIIIQGQIKQQFLQLKKTALKNHTELRKFMKKGDQINQINYHELEKNKPLIPHESSLTNIYKSNNNILNEIAIKKDERIKRIYLPQRKPSFQSKKVKTYKSLGLKRNSTKSKQIQTQQEMVNTSRYPAGLTPLKAIIEDDDQDLGLQRKKQMKINSYFSTTQKNQRRKIKTTHKFYQPQKVVQKFMFETPETKISQFDSHIKPIGNESQTNFWGGQKMIKPIEDKWKHMTLDPITKGSKEISIGKFSDRSFVGKYKESKIETQVTDYAFKNHLDNEFKNKQQPQNRSIQFPEISEFKISDHRPKKSVHSINMNFQDPTMIAQTYKPKSQFISNIDIQKFQIKKYKNGVYFGQLSQKVEKEGKGAIFYFNGRLYEGNFSNDTKNGKGFEYFADGSTYKGMFLNGFKDGKGIFEWPNGEVYDGQWKEGKQNGSGMWKGPNDECYIGQWKKGNVQGFGVFFNKAGNRYEGEFKNSKKHGLGTEREPNGNLYVGEFAKDRPNGQGELYFINGDIYKGNFSNGLKHGEGTMKTKTGLVYKGQYRNDKRCGYGQQTLEEGETYVGNFQNDLRHGYGEIYKEDKCLFKGYWLNGQKVSDETPKPKKSKKKDEKQKKRVSPKKTSTPVSLNQKKAT